MEKFDERLAEEVRKHPHLYDSRGYKDILTAAASWKEVAQTLQVDDGVCRQRWKNLRDRFVRAKKKIESRSGDRRDAPLPYIVTRLSWLTHFVRHRESESNFPHSEETEESVSDPMVESHGCELSQSLVMLPASPNMSNKSPPAVEVSLSALSEDEVDIVPLSSSSTCSTNDRLRPAIIPPGAATPSAPGPGSSRSPLGSSGRRRPRKRRLESIDEFIIKRLEIIDQHREELQQLNDEDTRFALAMADILRKLPPRQKSLAKLKIHQLLFETEQGQQV